MSGFLSKTTALTVFKIDNAAAVTRDKLLQFRFMPIDNVPEAKAWGWTSIDDMFDTEWKQSGPEKGHFVCFAFRVDTRRIPPAVLKKHLAEALRAEEAQSQANGKTSVSRARKKELKELYTAKLMKQTEPVPVSVDLALDTTTGLLYVGTASKSMLEKIEEHLQLSFTVQATCMVLAGLEDKHDLDEQAVERMLMAIHEHELQVEHEGELYLVSSVGQATLTQEGDVEVALKNAPDSVSSAGLAAGLAVKKLKLQICKDESCWELTIDGHFSFSGLRTPAVGKADDEDPDAAILEKLYLIDLAVGVMHSLFRLQAGA